MASAANLDNKHNIGKTDGIKAYIYTLTDPRTNLVRYIGKTINLKSRLTDHLREKLNTHKCNWIAKLKAAGLQPQIEAIEEFYQSQEAEWMEAERFYIEYFRQLGMPLTNLESGGIQGKQQNAETRAKIRAAKLNQSPETRAKISATKTGVKRSDESKARISAYAINRTPEHKAKIQAALMGRKRTEESKLKQSASLKANPSPAGMAALAAGRHLRSSPDAIAKSAAARTGLKRTPEQRKRMSIAAQLRCQRKAMAQ